MTTSLMKKTLTTMAIMVGACVMFVGTLTLLIVVVLGRPTPPDSTDSTNGSPGLAPPATDVPRGPNAPTGPNAPRRGINAKQST